MSLLLSVGPRVNHAEVLASVVVRITVNVIDVLSVALTSKPVANESAARSIPARALALHSFAAVVLLVIAVHH